MSVSIQNRKLYSSSAEIDIVDHCNLSCRSCSHLSPIADKSLLSPTELAKDLSLLARCFTAERLKILGGEPLLHPNLAEIAEVVQASGIAKKVAIITNGHLLARLDARTLAAVDEIVISAYVSAPPPAELLQDTAERASAAGVSFRVNRFERFRETFSLGRSDDPNLVRRVYNTCEIAHQYHCFSIYQGYFFKCPQARSVGRLTGKAFVDDGVRIDGSPDLFDRLVCYLSSPFPLSACSQCLGTVGRQFEHIQVSRQDWTARSSGTYEELIDMNRLCALERGDAGSLSLSSPVVAVPNSPTSKAVPE